MSQQKKQSYNVGVNTKPLLAGISKGRAKTATVAAPTGVKEREIKHLRISNSVELKNSYNFGKQIGRGGFGTVISVVDKNNESQWAMKIISKEALGKKLDSIHREIQILKIVEHPHIIYLDRVYESVRKIYLILERCFGTLSQVYAQNKPFSEDSVKKVVSELLSAVSYLHRNDIVHRDLKLENILIAKNPNDENDKLYIKLTDFGLGIIKKGNTFEDMLHDCCGTLLYMAPEVITKHSYSELCDVWAIGVITYTLLSGAYPFQSTNEEELADLICEHEPNFTVLDCSTQALHLLSKMFIKNPALRITAAEAAAHSWILGKGAAQNSDNVLDMMRMWRSEMMLPVGDECDWVSSAKAAGSSPGMLSNPSSESHLDECNDTVVELRAPPIFGTKSKVSKSKVQQTPPRASQQREMMRLPVTKISLSQESSSDDKLFSTINDRGKRAPGGGAAANQQQSSGRSDSSAAPTAASTSKRREKITRKANERASVTPHSKGEKRSPTAK